MRTLVWSLVLIAAAVSAAWADEAPHDDVSSSPWAAVAIFAVVIGMIAGIAIWRRRR